MNAGVGAIIQPLTQSSKRKCGFKALVDVPIARHQSAAAILKISQRTKAIMFQFEEPIGVVEWFQRTGKFRGYNRREHSSILPDGDPEMIQTEPYSARQVKSNR